MERLLQKPKGTPGRIGAEGADPEHLAKRRLCRTQLRLWVVPELCEHAVIKLRVLWPDGEGPHRF